ncbi:MAG: MBOAT family protein [Acidimicrobiales bacterium]
MLFPTVAFAVFFVVAFAANWSMPSRGDMWRVTMLGFSLFFYAWWNPYGPEATWWWRPFALLLVASVVGNFIVGRLVGNAMPHGERTRKSRRYVVLGVSANLGLLGYFKYYALFTTTLANSLNRIGLDWDIPLLNVILPVGISFYTFQAISYVVDVGRGDSKSMRLLDLGVYLTFFPQLVAGPIVRVREFIPQMNTRANPAAVQSARAIGLITGGLFKKVVISSYLASNIVDPVFNQPDDRSAQEVIMAVYGYAIQIYADFSGYTDIAIGAALLLGFSFPDNFDSPYRALSVNEFWRRWHMTLSRWLRDYLYFPLGGNRGSRMFVYRNLMLVMLIGGLWHGAAWNFVVWGGIHGSMLVWERWTSDRGLSMGLAPWVRWLLTFNIVCLAWVFFRAASFSDAMLMLSRLVHFGESPLVTVGVVAVIVLTLAAQFLPPGWADVPRKRFGDLPWVAQGAIFGLALMLISALGPVGVSPFIYFQF